MWMDVTLGASCALLATTLGWRCTRAYLRWRVWWFVYGCGVAGLTSVVALRVDGPEKLAILWFTAASLVLAGVDVLLFRLPNAMVYPTVTLVAGWLVAAALVSSQPSVALRVIAAGVTAGLAYLVLHLVSRQGLGMGDVKFAPAVAMVMGWHSWGWVVVSALGAFFLAAIWGLCLLLLRRANRQLPFGPFMVAGAAATPLVGDPLVQWWW